MHKSGDLKTYCFLVIFALAVNGCSKAQVKTEPILPGVCQTEEYLPEIVNERVGLVVNKASMINQTHLVDTLLSRGVGIQKIFTPEHGFKGTADAGAHVEDEVYEANLIPVISLYGNKRKPSSEDFSGLDVILFDLQDVGLRFYTYISSLHYIMETCAEEEIRLIVLDRPNPNGHYVDGPVLDPEFSSFVGMHTVPVVYGMSIGEYAQMINGENWLADDLHCDLLVIKCKNYDHQSYYNLPVWPSPNLASMRSIYLYPSTAFFEGTVASEGRGTSAPFQLIGHPDYPDKEVEFIPVSIPGASMNPKLKDKTCYGIDLSKIPIDELRSQTRLNLSYLLDFYKAMNMKEAFFIDYFDLLAGNGSLRMQIVQGMNEQEIRDSWKAELDTFKKIRAKYLLYPDFE